MRIILLLLFFSFSLLTFSQDSFTNKNFKLVTKQLFENDLSNTLGFTKLSDSQKEMYKDYIYEQDILFFIKNNDFSENIIINNDAPEPTQNNLLLVSAQYENVIEVVADDALVKSLLLESGIRKFQEKYLYLYLIIENTFVNEGLIRISNQYIISMHNQSFHIVINSFDGITIDDVFSENGLDKYLSMILINKTKQDEK